MPVMGINDLLSYNSADRKLRAYAYLTASLNERDSMQDVVDCIVPFVVAGISEQAGSFLDLSRLSTFVGSLGIKIPIYVLEQLMPRLQKLDVIQWNNQARHFLCVSQPQEGELPARNSPPILNEAFDIIDGKLAEFAAAHGVEKPPVSETWSDALISFLKLDSASDVMKSITIKGSIIGDSKQIETFIAASFIQLCEATSPQIYSNIIKVFSGVLIEDFLNNIQIAAPTEKKWGLSIYYDTTLLLRLLGTSGKLLQSATLEMHRALEDLGCKTLFFDPTAEEIYNILDSLIGAHSQGIAIYGETAEAIIQGDITIAKIKEIKATFAIQLNQLGIFEFGYVYAARKNEDIFQISESDLAARLEAEAASRDRTYKRNNALNDARVVALIVRLRRDQTKRDLSACGHAFVSRNALLQRISAKYCHEEIDAYAEQTIPPVLTAGQVTTIAWLSTSRTLDDHKVGKELLAACYNAVQPSATWAEQFSRALQDFEKENPGFAEQRANDFLFLHSARNAAREESLGQPSLLRKVNVAELFQKAARASERKELEQQALIEQIDKDAQAKIEKNKAELEELTQQTLAIVLEQGQIAGKSTHRKELISRVERISNTAAKLLIYGVRGFILIILLAIAIVSWRGVSSDHHVAHAIIGIIYIVVSVLSMADLFGWKIVGKPIATLEKVVRMKVASLGLKIFVGEL